MQTADGAWMVIVPRQYDIAIVDEQTLRHPCVNPSCGVDLELVHLQDQDTYRLWYGGYCGKCGCEQDVELGGDVMQCRSCGTALQPVSDNPYEEVAYCPSCDPTAPEVYARSRGTLAD